MQIHSSTPDTDLQPPTTFAAPRSTSRCVGPCCSCSSTAPSGSCSPPSSACSAADAKLIAPDFLGGCEFITYGRLQPVHINALVYGWGVQAALGIMLWIMARRSGQELRSGKSLLIAAGVFWNITITFGLLAILMGKSTSMEWLEMPKFVWPVLLTCFLCYAWPIARMFGRAFRPEGFMVSTWYILGACFWFPGSSSPPMSPALPPRRPRRSRRRHQCLVRPRRDPAVLRPRRCRRGLLLHPEDHRPAHRLRAARQQLVSGRSPSSAAGRACRNTWAARCPPGWSSIGACHGVLLLIPVGLVGLNHHLTTLGKHDAVSTSPTLRFIFFGSLFYPVSGFILASSAPSGPAAPAVHPGLVCLPGGQRVRLLQHVRLWCHLLHRAASLRL
jgi:cytochrome c oxidase cbb3-type subunit 1